MKTKIIAWITGLLTLTLAVFSFILSFNALQDLALKHNISVPPLFPFVVEFAVVIFSLNALYRSLHNESAKWQWCLIIGSSLLAGMFNVVHASNDIISQVMAAMPSLFLLLSFESFLSLIRYGIQHAGLAQSKSELGTLVDRYNSELAQIQNNISTFVTDNKKQLALIDNSLLTTQQKLNSLIEEVDNTVIPSNDTVVIRREKLLDILNTSPVKPTQKALAEELNVSVQTIRTDIKALNGRVKEN